MCSELRNNRQEQVGKESDEEPCCFLAHRWDCPNRSLDVPEEGDPQPAQHHGLWGTVLIDIED